jgi:hypothetical protein
MVPTLFQSRVERVRKRVQVYRVLAAVTAFAVAATLAFVLRSTISERWVENARPPSMQMHEMPLRSGASADVDTRRDLPREESIGTGSVPVVPSWLGVAEILPEILSPTECSVAISYIGPLIEHAANDAGREYDSQSADDLDAQAAAAERLELWRAVDKKVRENDYLVAVALPSSIRPPPGVRCEVFPASRNGKSVSLVFVFDRIEAPVLFDAAEYAKDMARFRLEEVARKFNSLDDGERRRIYGTYQKMREQMSWNDLPLDMQRQFPLENTIDESSLLMFFPTP